MKWAHFLEQAPEGSGGSLITDSSLITYELNNMQLNKELLLLLHAAPRLCPSTISNQES